ncbi:hypothetical protein M407DRAFT_244677 [Tulasnella calospora MUT 4182]|uniref:Uncharacterized protein n=1 Tax=Tulasnella calospora MUT 4182 TaxID=1051891 RepID=A0A0C3QDL4_9AGAM|nr:hypothetical protein M407DRAFT_244677 [Tulasnella calospora MUT 4182]
METLSRVTGYVPISALLPLLAVFGQSPPPTVFKGVLSPISTRCTLESADADVSWYLTES